MACRDPLLLRFFTKGWWVRLNRAYVANLMADWLGDYPHL